MAYERHWLLSWGGTLGNGSDIWSNNVRMMNDEAGGSDTLGDSTMEGLLDDFVGDIRALFANGFSRIPSSVSCTWVKFNEIGPDGRYVDQSTTHVRFLEGFSGANAVITGTGTANLPTFVSACITTTTARQRGPASKGRLFVPQPRLTVTPEGRFNTMELIDMANAWATFFTDLGNEDGLDTNAIAPYVVSSVGTTGPVARITGIKIGDVPDYISRRKNAMAETYHTKAVSTA